MIFYRLKRHFPRAMAPPMRTNNPFDFAFRASRCTNPARLQTADPLSTLSKSQLFPIPRTQKHAKTGKLPPAVSTFSF
jgi:hypothetical protein